MKWLREYIEYRQWRARRDYAIHDLRAQAEHPNTDKQLRRYLNAVANMLEGPK